MRTTTHSDDAPINVQITLAIPMFIELIQLAPTDPIYRSLIATYTRQCEALLKYQDHESGLWHTLLVDPTSYLETSASAGFAAGMLMGIRLGLLDRAIFLPCAEKALEACCKQVDDGGEVGNVSMGTPMGHDLQFYKDIPIVTMAYGQSLVIVALAQWLRLQETGGERSGSQSKRRKVD